ncbi:MAG: hypothetical protein C0515_04825 [Novosphingobium sp.]|nr:hypothetical protein [Novosphingobium sp.]MBX9644488.1 hypothetical protein [Novosphingobium sp.]
MPKLVKIMRGLALVLSTLAAGFATTAQAQTACGITGSATASPAVYDPFNPSGLASTNISMNITRVNPGGGGKTSEVNFYLKANPSTGAAANGTQIIPQSVAGSANITGIGLNIFYNYAAAAPTLTPINITPSGSNRFLKIEFTGNNAASDTVQVTFQVNLPANLDLGAVQNLAFDAFFACEMSGGAYNNQTQTGSFPNAVVFPVTVLSALRTYYAGTALDFGEIGAITTASLPGTPQRTNPSNHVFVQSSGAYSVTLSSQNAFKLFKPGAAVTNDKIDYRLRFLGTEVDSTSTPTPGATAISRSCQRATLSTMGNVLPIQAKLLEGGQGKNPSPTYTDVLTITVTPLVYSDPGTNACATYSLTGF